MKTYFLDLFAGIGGFALGAEWAGVHYDKHYFSEVDDYAIRVYEKRFPGAVALGDITKIDGTSLPAGDWIIAGGFPCQDISVAGKGAGLAGARSGLWYEYARIIKEIKPRYAIMENVGALASRGFDKVLQSLAKIGYDAEWQDIRASDVGAPHRRERIWIVAYPGGARTGSIGGEAGTDNGRGAGWNESALRQDNGADGADRSTPTSEIEGDVAYPDEIRLQHSSEKQNNTRKRDIQGQPQGSGADVAYPDLQHGQRRPEPQQPASDSREPRNQSAWRGIETAGNVADADEAQCTRDGSAKPDGQEYATTRRLGSRQEWWTALAPIR